jgi:diamine N-acetyltransferase
VLRQAAIVAEPVLILEPVSRSNVRQVCSLRVAPHQEPFVSPNAESLAEAYVVAEAVPRALRVDDALVGFVMLYDSPGEPALEVWRLMLDAQHQGRGFGRAAVEAVLAYARARPQTRVLTVGAEEGKGGPAGFYERLGFRRTGEVRHGSEIRYELPITEPGFQPNL